MTFENNWKHKAESRDKKHEQREKPKYYTCLAAKYEVGDVITGRSSNFEVGGNKVFMTNSPVPHYTIIGREDTKDNYIYRVRPLGKIKHGGDWDELVAQSVEVLECLGKAKPYINKLKTNKIQPSQIKMSRPVGQEGVYNRYSGLIDKENNIEADLQLELKRLIKKIQKKLYLVFRGKYDVKRAKRKAKAYYKKLKLSDEFNPYWQDASKIEDKIHYLRKLTDLDGIELVEYIKGLVN